MKTVSFVIPCYKSEKTIKIVIDEIISIFSKCSNYDYEVIAVNDNSPDNVYDVLRSIAETNKKIKVIDLAKNFGQPSAQMAGVNYCKGDYVVFIDDDGQCPSDKVWNLIGKLEDGFDVAVARYPKKKQSLFKNLGSHFNSLMVRTVMSVPKDFYMSNFFAIKKYIIDEMIKYNNPYPYLIGLIVRTTNNIGYVRMEERSRLEGKTGYTLNKLISFWMNGLTAYSIIPLRISSFIGIICALLGFVFGVIVIIKKFLIPNISAGWSSSTSLILFIGGLLMLMIGIIGEYIGRIYMCINNSPQFVIKEKINIDNAQQ